MKKDALQMRLIDNITYFDNIILFNISTLYGRKFLSNILRWISHSANGYYYPLIPVLLMFVDAEMAWSFFLTGLAAFALELPVNKILKIIIKRARPFEVLNNINMRILSDDRFSFPSGHSAGAFLTAVLLSCYYPILILPAFIWASLVGISRVFLGVHYPTDVLAGMAIGILSAITGIQLAGWII
jgi:undecaprenyl-diphosphatase